MVDIILPIKAKLKGETRSKIDGPGYTAKLKGAYKARLKRT